jgi:glutathione S-transferase
MSTYVFEALRFNPQNPFLYRVSLAPYVLAKGTPRETSIEPGTFVVAATSSAMFDSSVVKEPNTFRLDRPRENYMFFGYGLHACFGTYINAISIPQILKPLLRLSGLRRAAGSDGKLVFDGPFPNGLIVQFDAPAATPVASGTSAAPAAVAATAVAPAAPAAAAALPALITIPPSLECEAARWTLQYYGVAFEEQAHSIPVIYEIMKKLGVTDFPILVLPEKPLSGETQIFQYFDDKEPPERRLGVAQPPDPAQAMLNKEIIANLGPSARCWAYFNLLPHKALMVPVFTRGIPDFEHDLVVAKYDDIVASMLASLNITAETAAAGLQDVSRIFDQVDKKLLAGAHFLQGDRFSLADLLFAVQSAPVIMPPEYGGALPPFSQLPPLMQNVINAMRDRPAGRFALRIYREYRNAV